MIDLLAPYDPATGEMIDRATLRASVDEKLGLTPQLGRARARFLVRGWVFATGAFVAVAVVFLPQLFGRPTATDVSARAFADLPGVVAVIVDTPQAGGGVRTHALDGDSIWVMGGLSHQLNRIDALTNSVVDSYHIDDYVEGLAIGGGYLWLRSYDDGGRILRFNPETGVVDLVIPFPSIEGHIVWWDNHLLVSNEDGEVSQIAVEGDVQPFGPGLVLYQNQERLWLGGLEQADGSKVLVSSQGNTARFDGNVVSLTEAGGYLWVIDDHHDLSRVAIDGEGTLTVATGPYPKAAVEHDGSLWYVDFHADTLSEVDLESAEVVREVPLGGRPGDVFSADGSLFVSLYQPGLLLRIDTRGELASTGPRVIESTTDGYRLYCTGDANSMDDGPTVLLDPEPWLGPGMWSVVQSTLSEGGLVCSHGAVDEADIDTKNANLIQALQDNQVPAPYVLVSVWDAAFSTLRLTEQLDDVVGVALIDPQPPGFNEWLQQNRPEDAPTGLTPRLPDADLLGNIPLILVSHDLDLTLRGPDAAAVFGSEQNRQDLEQLWIDGLELYAGLSTNSRLLEASDSYAGIQVVWQDPDIVVNVVNDLRQMVR